MNPVATPTPPPLPLPDIRGIVPPQPYSLGAASLWALAIIAALLVVVLLIRYFYRRRAKPAPPLTPRAAAAARLLALRRKLEELDAREFGGEVCDVLRSYVGAQYRLRLDRQTSAEFLVSIAGSSVFSPLEQSLLAEFLNQCDLLKFARADATTAAKEHLLEQAEEFVAGSQAAPPPVPALAEPLAKS